MNSCNASPGADLALVQSRCLVVLPARIGSTRLPRKMLADVGGVPLIVASARNAARAGMPVVVAADDPEIVLACRQHGVRVIQTAVGHQSGTDRIVELVGRLRPEELRAGIINVQGDEPFMPPEIILGVAQRLLATGCGMATAVVPLANTMDWRNPNIVKAVVTQGRALYFSRAAVPFDRDAGGGAGVPACAFRHLGIYGYTVDVLRMWPDLPASQLERIEKLEQWRALEAGIPMAVYEAKAFEAPAIDTPHDLELAREWMRRRS